MTVTFSRERDQRASDIPAFSYVYQITILIKLEIREVVGQSVSKVYFVVSGDVGVPN